MTKSTMSKSATSKTKAMTKSSPKTVAKEPPSQHSCTKAWPGVSSTISPVSPTSTILYNHSCVPPTPSTSSWALLIALSWVTPTSSLVATPMTTRGPRGSVALIVNRWSPWVARRCRRWWSSARGLVWGWVSRLRGVGLRRKYRVNKGKTLVVLGVCKKGVKLNR